jgi:type IV secretion system protein VirB4
LGLGPLALALCGASDPASQALIERVLAENHITRFATAFLRARGLDWAVPLLAAFTKENLP